ncbi:MAG: hypothetical protein JNJ61_13435 [Anaerolineae bacterium]|nr:hypothetical protein [Anaerolineae bacterium]
MVKYRVTNVLLLALSIAAFLYAPSAALDPYTPPPPACRHLTGLIINPMERLQGWNTLTGNGAISVFLQTTHGFTGHGIQLAYDLGSNNGAWVQMRLDFPVPRALTGGDHLRFYYYGSARNTIEIGLVSDTNQNYFGSSWNEAAGTPWWSVATWDINDFRTGTGARLYPGQKVKAVFISVTKSASGVGGTGRFVVDELQLVNLFSRPVQTSFTSPAPNAAVRAKTATWIAARQQPGGLLKSWQEEPFPYAYLYDQALALIVLAQTDLAKARLLVNRIHLLQLADGTWYDVYDYGTNASLTSVRSIGPVAWMSYALTRYALRETDTALRAIAVQDAWEAAEWLVTQQQPDGSLLGDVIEPITEWNLDGWWALQATGHITQANALRDYLLNMVWDPWMGRFKSSTNRYQIFLDNQTWGAAFLRAVGRATDARRALSYARYVLPVMSSDGSTCGLDGNGPFSVWHEGTLQYIDQGGENSTYYMQQVMKHYAADGGLRNSPDDFSAYIVWLSRWHGIAPTAWLYFANADGPFTLTPPPPVT